MTIRIGRMIPTPYLYPYMRFGVHQPYGIAYGGDGNSRLSDSKSYVFAGVYLEFRNSSSVDSCAYTCLPPPQIRFKTVRYMLCSAKVDTKLFPGGMQTLLRPISDRWWKGVENANDGAVRRAQKRATFVLVRHNGGSGLVFL